MTKENKNMHILFPRMCLSLYDYQSKARRYYRKGLLCLKNRLTTNQKYTIDSQKPKTREHKNQDKRKSSNHEKKNRKKKGTKETKNQLENKA